MLGLILYKIQGYALTDCVERPLCLKPSTRQHTTRPPYAIVWEYGRDFPLDWVWKSKVFFSVEIDELCLVDIRTA